MLEVLLGRDRCLELLTGALRVAKEAAAEGVLSSEASAVTRFAENRIHQNVYEEDAGLSFRVALGRRVGGARTNGLEGEGPARCARRALEIAEAQVEDAHFPGLVASPPAEARGGADYDEPTAALGAEERARAVLQAIEAAREAGLAASGALTVGSGETAVANSLGTAQHHRSTTAQLHVVVREGTAEGAFTETANRFADIDPRGVARRAAEKCRASVGASEVEPGEYPVVLEPEAAAALVEMLAYMGLGGLSVIEGRSFMCGREGERAVSEMITLADDPLLEGGPVRPFDYEGVPKRRLELIARGVLKTAVYDTRTGARASVPSTGHALPEPNTFGPYPLNLVLEGGDSSLEEMIDSTSRGILVSRFHYTNPVDPKRTVITGMTRFGTFLIEDGKVTRPVRSMRFTDSVLEALGRVEAVGKDLVRAGDGDIFAPALKLSSWRFTGVTGD